MLKLQKKAVSRLRRKRHTRKKIYGTSQRPRLSVFRSSKHIYGQIIDDDARTTILSASSLEREFSASGGNKDGAAEVGKILAARALEKGITEIVFDRNGFLYHGRIKAFADGAREAGLKF